MLPDTKITSWLVVLAEKPNDHNTPSILAIEYTEELYSNERYFFVENLWELRTDPHRELPGKGKYKE